MCGSFSIKDNMNKECIGQICGKAFYWLLTICLWLLFIYWAGLATLKYIAEPVTTAIQYKREIQPVFPLISICEADIPKKNNSQIRNILRECLIDGKDLDMVRFFATVQSCLGDIPDLDVETMMTKFQNYNLEKYVENVTIRTDEIIMQESSLMNQADNIWSMTFHYKFGPCFTLDVQGTFTLWSVKLFLGKF